MATSWLRAIEAGGRMVEEPSEDELHVLLADMNLSHPFVILQRFDREPADQHYMQACLRDDMTYQVEYREGGADEHYQAHVGEQYSLSGPEVIAPLMADWARDGRRWREALPWTPLEM
ncbi:hypothetical protein [Streptomyces sp. HNM0574]|uniref:hypothetical protein n=1 Tax=Streptomyces sp. HNM0574 TaxID=2714954 RepID=UPI00146B361E|nr:hypothetical protein [Streptomyces sp. HNM0574]NLU68243.1 hypothetical protein [Streptomyces sp. HNM0574]